MKVWKILVFLSVFGGLTVLFVQIGKLRILQRALMYTKQKMDEVSRQRLLHHRKMLRTLQRRYDIWYRLEQELYYSGLKHKFHWMSAEIWLACNLVIEACILTVSMWLADSWQTVLLAAVLFPAVEYVWFVYQKSLALRKVEEDLLKFLDFMGNYSLTSGEMAMTIFRVSRFLGEPLRGVLENCSYEIQTTGDAGLALNSMVEKIEHPQFKEIVRNIEVAVRYCANLKGVVGSSRRSVREQMKSQKERESMLREATINLFLLLALSGFIFVLVDRMIAVSMKEILFHTLPGKMGIGILAAIFWMFARQLYKIRR